MEMKIPKEQAEKLKRYFINADPFLWGVLEAKNKKGRLKELKKNGFLQSYSESSNATYSKINQDLLVELGIDGILEHIVVPRVTKAFAPDVLRYFQRCWDQGQNPDMKYFIEHKLYRRRIFGDGEVYESRGFQFDRKGFGRVARVVGHKDLAQLFVQIDTQHNFVERWTVFAGLWFEEIEPLLDSMREGVSEGSNIKSGLKPSTTE
jgi:hypothetical protein